MILNVIWAVLMGIFAFSDVDKMKTNTASTGCCITWINGSSDAPVYCTDKNAEDENTRNVTYTFNEWFLCMFGLSVVTAIAFLMQIVGIAAKKPWGNCVADMG